MNEPVLVDTGPLVAMLRDNDAHHMACVRAAEGIAGPALTTWPVLTEAAWILRQEQPAVLELLRYVELRLVEAVELLPDAAAWMGTFYRKYADLKPQLADASLMYVAEQNGIEHVFTLDRRDFTIFRCRGKALTLIP